MPGGYGTEDTDWGTSGTTSPRGSYSAPSGNVRQEGSNRVADAVNIARAAPPQISASLDLQNQAQLAIIEENKRRGIGSYAPPPITQTQTGGSFGGYETPQQQLAASLMDAGALTSGALGGQALWSKLPVGMAEEIRRKGGDPTLYANEYFSSFAPGAQAHSPTGIIEITGPGALYENGQLVEGEPAEYNIVNPYSSSDPWNSWEDPWYGGHTQGEDDSMSDMARHYWFSESLDDVSAREAQRKEEGLGVATMANMEQMYDKNFAAKASPMADPGFSEFAMGERGTTAAEDIMYSKGLFETART